ncbi:MAG: MBL fold metallo-hydrolase, partial [Phycisphaerae bacterium]
ILEHIRNHDLRPDALILTHGHLDHIAGVPIILGAFESLPVHMAEAASVALTDPSENLSADQGLPVAVGEIPTIDLAPESRLMLDVTEWHILDTSGHAPGSRSLYCEAAAVVIVGDALFQGSIGNTAFHHSDARLLIQNIRTQLLTLPEETQVYSGHGPTTTIGEEKRSNPFLQA